ncbi:hypothetical protein DNTS_030202 [Danionella cerebrum]|uniref:Uncharacterized protein n=1 Tax=Danionella cerebrum TaxID=2873325 RepID=A0A553Q888_9TELE|nr:hypothetical protein DNTS_030202 [Danionella translucida]
MPSQDAVAEPRGAGTRRAPPVPPRRDVPGERRVKCVLVGDGAVGKSSLIISYTTNGYPAEHIPTAFDHFSVRVVVDGRPVHLHLCDMAGEDEFERLRPLCYHDADVFLLCYSVVSPSSFRSTRTRWTPEVRRFCPDVPIILVGTRCDQVEDVQELIRLADAREKPVTPDEGRVCARSIGAVSFIECSALTQKNLKIVFDAAIVASLRERAEPLWPRIRTLREKTPEKMKQLSEMWWKKLGCIQSFDFR